MRFFKGKSDTDKVHLEVGSDLKIEEAKTKETFTQAVSGILTSKVTPVEVYDFQVHGPLVNPKIPGGYTLAEEYWIKDGCSQVCIVQNTETHLFEYLLYEPEVTPFEHELLERLFEDMRDVLILNDDEIRADKENILYEKMGYLLSEYRIMPAPETLFKLEYFMLRNFLGWGTLDPLMNDPYLEDISCDGANIPVYIYHRKYQNIRASIAFKEEELDSLAITLAQRSGKHISLSRPILDATLPDGSRLQLTLSREITSRGTSFTIRKFRENPFTPIELLEYGTFSAEELAYFWLAIENNKSLLFVGGTASGKTSSLNGVSVFIPQLSKIVSIEDTREITLNHENWIASVTRESVVESVNTQIDMFDLLKAAMRQRPEYIIVGEVRGSEAQTLFQAMNTGHTTFSTLHANNVDAAIHRLENAPLNVPRNMVQALDIVSVQSLVYKGHKRVRRSVEIVELAGMDPGTGNLRVNNVFEYNPVSDKHSYTGRSEVYRSIMEMRGWSSEEMDAEIEKRIRVLEAMKEQKIRDYIRVSRIVQSYAIKPAAVLEGIDDLTQFTHDLHDHSVLHSKENEEFIDPLRPVIDLNNGKSTLYSDQNVIIDQITDKYIDQIRDTPEKPIEEKAPDRTQQIPLAPKPQSAKILQVPSLESKYTSELKQDAKSSENAYRTSEVSEILSRITLGAPSGAHAKTEFKIGEDSGIEKTDGADGGAVKEAAIEKKTGIEQFLKK